MQLKLESVLLKSVRNQLDIDVVGEAKLLDMPEEESLDSPCCESGVDVLASVMALRKLYNHPSLLLGSLNRHDGRSYGFTSGRKVRAL